MSSLWRFTGSLLLGAALLSFAGCGGEEGDDTSETTEHGEDGHHDHDGHEEHAHAETYDEAVTELDELYASIKEAAEAGDISKAHNPLHEVGHVLELVEDLAKEEKKTNEEVTEINAAIEELMTAYGDVDAALHADDGTAEQAFIDADETIVNAMKTLKKYQK